MLSRHERHLLPASDHLSFPPDFSVVAEACIINHKLFITVGKKTSEFTDSNMAK